MPELWGDVSPVTKIHFLHYHIILKKDLNYFLKKTVLKHEQ